MKRAFLFAALCAIAPLSTAVEAKTVHHRAAHHKLTDEEISRVVDEVFRKADVNHDDKLSRIELTTYGFSNNLGVAVKSKRWNMINTDHDDWISKDELHAYLKRSDGQ